MKKLLKIFVKAITLCSIILSLFFSLVTLPASAQNTPKQNTKSTEASPTLTRKAPKPPKIETKLDEPEINGPGGVYHPKQKVKS